jgi:hypothetical protein
MSRWIRLSPFDWDRHRGLMDALGEGRTADAIAALSAGPAWRSPDAASRLAALEERGIDLPGLRLELGLAADPPRFAADAARWLETMTAEERASVLVQASAVAEPHEIALSIDEVLGIFDPAWRRGWWPNGLPPRVAPEALELALGGLAPGAYLRDLTDVQRAAERLASLDVDALPVEGGPWLDGVDPNGDLDGVIRDALREIITVFEEAAREGWAIAVVQS